MAASIHLFICETTKACMKYWAHKNTDQRSICVPETGRHPQSLFLYVVHAQVNTHCIMPEAHATHFVLYSSSTTTQTGRAKPR